MSKRLYPVTGTHGWGCHYFDHFYPNFVFVSRPLCFLLNHSTAHLPLLCPPPDQHRAIQRSPQTTNTIPRLCKPHLCPSPAQAAASSKSDPSRPARDAAPQSPCSLCNLHVNPRLDLLHAFAVWPGSRTSRHNNTSKTSTSHHLDPFWSSHQALGRLNLSLAAHFGPARSALYPPNLQPPWYATTLCTNWRSHLLTILRSCLSASRCSSSSRRPQTMTRRYVYALFPCDAPRLDLHACSPTPRHRSGTYPRQGRYSSPTKII